MQIEVQDKDSFHCLLRERAVPQEYIDNYKNVENLEKALNKAVKQQEIGVTLRKTEILFCFESVHYNKLRLRVAFQSSDAALRVVLERNLRVYESSSLDGGEKPDFSLSQLKLEKSEFVDETEGQPISKANNESKNYSIGESEIFQSNASFAESEIPLDLFEINENEDQRQKSTSHGKKSKLVWLSAILMLFITLVYQIEYVKLYSTDKLVIFTSLFNFNLFRYNTVKHVLKDSSNNIYGINNTVRRLSLFSGLKESLIEIEPKFILNDTDNVIFVCKGGGIFKINNDLTRIERKIHVRGLKSAVSAIKYNSDYIIVSDLLLDVHLIPLKEELQKFTLSGLTDPAEEMLILPGNRLFTVSRNGKAAIFDLTSMRIVKRFRESSELRCLCRIDDNSIFVITANKAFIWDLEQNQKLKTIQGIDHTAHLCAVKGTNIYIYGEHTGLAVVSMNTGEIRTYPEFTDILSIQ